MEAKVERPMAEKLEIALLSVGRNGAAGAWVRAAGVNLNYLWGKLGK